jgi:serine/threonine protein phosphatase PrpC
MAKRVGKPNTGDDTRNRDDLDFSVHPASDIRDRERIERALDELLDATIVESPDADELDLRWPPNPGREHALLTSLHLGSAVANYRLTADGGLKEQEDRHCALNFPTVSADVAQDFLRDRIAKIVAATQEHKSGSTLTSVIVTRTGDIVTAHLGDSPVSAIIVSEDGKLKEVRQLTRDHEVPPGKRYHVAPDGTCFRDEEGRRFLESGASLNMTHAIGDRRFAGALCREPEVNIHHLQGDLVPGDRLLLLITSDGAHSDGTRITHSTHAETVRRGIQENITLDQIAFIISRNSATLGDHVTVLLLEVKAGEGAFAAVFDGHAGSQTAHEACSLFESYVREFAQEDRDTLAID